MRLTLVNFFKFANSRKTVNGHKYRGKYRIVPPVSPTDFNRLKDDFEREEENMFYLRHPYLTYEQSSGHGQALGLPEKRFEKMIMNSTRPTKPHVTIEEWLGHLRHAEKWD